LPSFAKIGFGEFAEFEIFEIFEALNKKRISSRSCVVTSPALSERRPPSSSGTDVPVWCALCSCQRVVSYFPSISRNVLTPICGTSLARNLLASRDGKIGKSRAARKPSTVEKTVLPP
jgi:hypothetical protein